MKNAAALLALALTSLVVGVGCSSAPEGGLDTDYTAPSKSKKDGDEEGASSLPAKTKSDTDAPPIDPTPAPTPAPSGTPTTPATPPPPTTPTVDPQACANLGQCCSQLTNTYGQLACAGVQLKGDPETCAKSLIACRATIGLGGGGGGAGACNVDKDCPGAERCIGGACR